ncbi:hypothetical protein C1Y40_05474 [Mycobacterium talmoniae]|uniref:Uncharacterized protein n=1 Tax=Mycobacterium talmoniae TaxID=1858794 RepID=A0A2S8BCJ5_9MYCO|nr:hypothetical protein C1Y40_05474 [Mycobacterium talmoniae]
MSTSVATHTASHSSRYGPPLKPIRARIPVKFWLVFSAVSPIRLVWNTVLVQYSTESRGAAANAARIVAARVASAVSAARRSRRNRKYSKNTAGVSFTAIASPSSMPRGHRVRCGRQSAMTNVISTALIWP